MDASHVQLLQTLSSEIRVGEKHKCLNELVHSVRSQKLDPSVIISTIQPVDYWSRKAKLDIAEIFHQSQTILDFLRSDEKLLINRVLRLEWIFRGDSILADPKYLTNDLFPYISCLCRQKILRRLSNHLEDKQKCENIFEAIEGRYGVENAQCILPSCSSKFISAVLSTRKLQLTNRQLLIILNKFPDIAVSYLESFFRSKQNKEPGLLWTSCGTSTDYFNRTLTSLAGKDSLRFMNIYEEFHDIISGFCLSIKTANRLVKFNIQRIIDNPKVYANVLNKDFLQRRLKPDQFESFFIGILPETIQHFRRNINELLLWLTKFPPSRKGEILKFGFERAYSQRLVDRIDCIPSNIVQYLLPNERMKIVDYKLVQDTSDDNDHIDYYESCPKHYESYWTAFRTIDKSISHIKELLFAESDSSLRSELLVQLVRTCSINEDTIALAEVCKYVVQRHRNENVQVLVDFLEAVDQDFKLLELDSSHWDSLRQILQLCLLEGDLTRYSFILNDILEKAFIYSMKSNLPTKSILSALVQMKTDITWGSNWRMETLRKKEYKSFEKSFLELAAEEIESKHSTEDSYHDPKKTKSVLALANCYSEWNKTCPVQDKLSFERFPWMLERLVELLESDDYTDITTVCQLLLSDPLLEKRTYMDRILVTNPMERTVLYFLNRDPKKVIGKIEDLLKFILKSKLKNYRWLLRSIRCYGPASLSSQIVEICKRIAEDSDAIMQERGNSVIMLSVLQNPTEFFEFISQFYPDGSKIEVEGGDDDVETNVQLVRYTLASLKNIESPSLGFPTLLRLCTGDYLKYSLGALYSLCLNSSVEKSLTLLNQLVDRPVSVKKHAIRLLCWLSTMDEVSQFMLKLWNAEKNASIKQEIVKQTFRIISNSSSGIWIFMKSALQSLSSKDKACLSEISKMENIEKIPSALLPEYFLLCKEVFSRDKVDKTLKICLLQAIGRNKYRLGSEFFENLIGTDFFSNDQENQVQQQLILLTISFLLSSPSEVQSSCLKIIERNFTRLGGPNFSIIYYGQCNNKFNNRKIFSFFIENLCTLSIDKHSDGQNYTDLFKQLQKSEFFASYKTETFGDFVFIQLALIFHLFGDKTTNMEEIGNQIGDLLDTHVSEYGKDIIGLFNKLLQTFLRQCCKSRCSSTEQILQLIEGLLRPSLTGSDSTARKFIALQLFPLQIICGKDQETYKRLANGLINSTETVVHMYAYNCLKL